jgi:hypothetical protein
MLHFFNLGEKMKYLCLLLLLSLNLLQAVEPSPILFTGDVRVMWENGPKLGELHYETNLSPKFVIGDVWAETNIRFTLADPLFNDSLAFPELDKALIGYKWDISDGSVFGLQIGRCPLDYIFDSKIQYHSHFNGLHVGHKIGDFSIHGGLSYIPDAVDRFLYLLEASYACEPYPLVLTYSFTHWEPEMPYSISQAKLSWMLAQFKKKPIKLYGAILKNHAQSKKSTSTYVGITLDQIAVEKDYSIELYYQYVERNSIPVIDMQHQGNESAFHLKGKYCLTPNLAFQFKGCFAHDKTTQLSAIFSW